MEAMKPSVLLVDDVEANLVALEALLDDLPCELVRANSGNAALRQLLHREFAVMLLDVQMPEMDGYEVAKYVRENRSTREVPIIFLTAMLENEPSVLRGYGSGAVDFLFKPVNPQVLRAKVRIFLELDASRRALAHEVEAHRRTLSELTVSNAALRHFTDAASHDLRAPLRAIRGFLEALAVESQAVLEASSREYLERSQRAAERMDTLLLSLLDYARLRKRAALDRVDLTQVLAHVLSDLKERIAAAEAEVQLDELPPVNGDADRLYQLFLNLIGNALKFRRPQQPAHVSVRAQRLGPVLRFCVEDDGIGVEPAYRKDIFGAFTRLHDQGRFEGAGLGLAICQQIVEQHGGRIWVEGRQPHGSRFYFELPADLPA